MQLDESEKKLVIKRAIYHLEYGRSEADVSAQRLGFDLTDHEIADVFALARVEATKMRRELSAYIFKRGLRTILGGIACLLISAMIFAILDQVPPGRRGLLICFGLLGVGLVGYGVTDLFKSVRPPLFPMQ